MLIAKLFHNGDELAFINLWATETTVDQAVIDRTGFMISRRTDDRGSDATL